MNSNIKVKKKKKIFLWFSVRNKLIIGIILASIIPLTILGYLSYDKSFKILEDKLILTSGQTIGEVNNELTRFLNGLIIQTEMLATNPGLEYMMDKIDIHQVDKDESIDGQHGENTEIELEKTEEEKIEEPDYKDMIIETLIGAKKSNPELTMTYLVTNEGDFYNSNNTTLTEGLDLRERDWYKAAIKNTDRVALLEPYKDAFTNEMVITASKAVVNGDKIIGVVGIDISLSKLSDELSSRVIGREGHLAVTDRNGIMLCHPDKELIGTEIVKEMGIWDQMEPEKGYIEYTYDEDGSKKNSRFVTNKLMGWKIIAMLSKEELLSDTNTIKDNILIVGIIGLIFAVSISLFISHSISKPLNKLKEAFKKMSKGDLTTKLQVKTNDEFRNISDSFNSTVANINQLIVNIKNSFEIVLDTSQFLKGITEETAAVADEVSKTIGEIASSSDEQSRGMESGVKDVNELAHKIDRVKSSTDYMKNVSNEADALIERGLNTVKILTEKSKENNKASTEVNEIVIKVDKSAEEIGVITDTIATIAEETNLLALNAAIEAARAGEQGKGFAIVAEEVRKLAEGSAKATSEIRQLILGIQEQSKAAVSSMEVAKKTVASQDEAVKNTENIFSSISSSITALIEKVSEIKDYGDDMDNKKNEIVDVITDISALSQQTSASTQQVSASTEEQLASIEEIAESSQRLKNLAEELQRSIDMFKTA